MFSEGHWRSLCYCCRATPTTSWTVARARLAQVPNQAPPFMGVNPNGQYRSYAGQASAPANMAASQAGTSQQQVSNPTVQRPCST